MYKLLLVSDQQDVLDAFAGIRNWELLGFKPPHIRHDFAGTVDSLAKHHADGICIAVEPDQEEQILAYLQQQFPNVSIFEAGRTEEEVLRYLSELKILLNRIHADFYNERSNTRDVLQMCRHEFFRKVINGKIKNSADLHRNMRLLRSRMDADRPCLLIELDAYMYQDATVIDGEYMNNGLHLKIACLPDTHHDNSVIHFALPIPDDLILEPENCTADYLILTDETEYQALVTDSLTIELHEQEGLQ